MSHEIAVLAALLRLSRRNKPTTTRELAVRAGADEADVQRALAKLTRAELVQSSPLGPRLTLSGLAVAVAVAAVARPAPRAKRLSGVPQSPLLRRRRAA